MIKINKVLYDSSNKRLAPRATEVLLLLRDGKTNKKIAKALIVSISIAKKYIENSLREFEVSDRTALDVTWKNQWGLTER